jgi:hypothetical protein
MSVALSLSPMEAPPLPPIPERKKSKPTAEITVPRVSLRKRPAEMSFEQIRPIKEALEDGKYLIAMKIAGNSDLPDKYFEEPGMVELVENNMRTLMTRGKYKTARNLAEMLRLPEERQTALAQEELNELIAMNKFDAATELSELYKDLNWSWSPSKPKA